MEIINNAKSVKARKVHKCDWCSCPIEVGEIHEKTTLKFEQIYTWRNHIKCAELVTVLNMEGCEGYEVSKQDFHDYIKEKYWKLSYGLDKEQFFTFKDKVEFVYNSIMK